MAAGDRVIDGDGLRQLAYDGKQSNAVATGTPECCCAASECWVKPKNCLTGVEHPLIVVPCSDVFYVFQISGAYDCWYVDSYFTQYPAVPDGYSSMPTPESFFDTCEDCNDVEYPGECTVCLICEDLYVEGDIAIVTWGCHNYVTSSPDCDCGQSGSAVLTYNDSSGQFEGTGTCVENLSWELDPTTINGKCSWTGTIDADGTGSCNVLGGPYGGSGQAYRDAVSVTNNNHVCGFDPGDPLGFRYCDVSLSIIPSGNRCIDPDTSTCVDGTSDDFGCCA